MIRGALRRLARDPRQPLARVFVYLAVLILAVLIPALTNHLPSAQAACPARPTCKGCGCKGGPGYRGPDGRCVGFADLTKVCGHPPTTRCTFENAPGTGANRECAVSTPSSAQPGVE